jgi:hypothetical protein
MYWTPASTIVAPSTHPLPLEIFRDWSKYPVIMGITFKSTNHSKIKIFCTTQKSLENKAVSRAFKDGIPVRKYRYIEYRRVKIHHYPPLIHIRLFFTFAK